MGLLNKLAQRDPDYHKKKNSGKTKLTDIIKKSLKSNPDAIWNQGKGGRGKD